MAAAALDIERLRRMVADPNDTYDDDLLAQYIEAHPLADGLGRPPTIRSSTQPETLIVNPDWEPTYDLNAAAADIWEEKAAALAGKFDFSADGASYSRSQQHTHAQQMARYYRSRRSARTVTLVVEPQPSAAEREA